MKALMTDAEFVKRTQTIYEQVMRYFEEVDPDIAEAFFHLDNITISFFDGTRFVLNRQPPVHQIWLATKRKGHHFHFDPATEQWVDTKTGDEFWQVFRPAVDEYLHPGQK